MEEEAEKESENVVVDDKVSFLSGFSTVMDFDFSKVESVFFQPVSEVKVKVDEEAEAVILQQEDIDVEGVTIIQFSLLSLFLLNDLLNSCTVIPVRWKEWSFCKLRTILTVTGIPLLLS